MINKESREKTAAKITWMLLGELCAQRLRVEDSNGGENLNVSESNRLWRKKIRIRVLLSIFSIMEGPQLLLIQNMVTLAGKRESEKKLNGVKSVKIVRSGGRIMEREEDKE
ncbi:hypothetical protein DEO72_LG7g3127 [Vigna unguiculata]|uniref:Uncharacterized protein n=1 Tax=Vigna unguiculata TaxID=3917 RepID=A0A4D6MPD0_VIGUN|nr:hypothetical protein DEO72_LG7g3127 [Vigna unguiculata]